MIIKQFKIAPIAMSPDAIAYTINKYTKHKSRVSDTISDNDDIIHFHNKYIQTDKKCLIQYHSEPAKTDRSFPGVKLVIDQYHSTLPEYKTCIPVRNIINFENYPMPAHRKSIKVGYSPSITKKHNEWYNKGYSETVSILKKLGIKYDIITGVPLKECIKRKSRCNIIIDECVTDSFHRSGLEGLALGKLTICSLGDEVRGNIHKHSPIIPFFDIRIENLEEELYNIIKEGIDFIIHCGKKSREWMERYWHPRDIIKEYIDVYKSI